MEVAPWVASLPAHFQVGVVVGRMASGKARAIAELRAAGVVQCELGSGSGGNDDDNDDNDDVRQAMKDLDRFELNHGGDDSD